MLSAGYSRTQFVMKCCGMNGVPPALGLIDHSSSLSNMWWFYDALWTPVGGLELPHYF